MASGRTATGVVKRVVGDKGFGFIRGDSDGVEYFFHRSAVSGDVQFDELREGRRVSFTATEGAKGPRADQVRAS
jgi:cold shock protein